MIAVSLEMSDEPIICFKIRNFDPMSKQYLTKKLLLLEIY